MKKGGGANPRPLFSLARPVKVARRLCAELPRRTVRIDTSRRACDQLLTMA